MIALKEWVKRRGELSSAPGSTSTPEYWGGQEHPAKETDVESQQGERKTERPPRSVENG